MNGEIYRKGNKLEKIPIENNSLHCGKKYKKIGHFS